MTAFATLPETFNNPKGFERGLWWRKTGGAVYVQKKEGFWNMPNGGSAD
jgi:hypothetical protein